MLRIKKIKHDCFSMLQRKEVRFAMQTPALSALVRQWPVLALRARNRRAVAMELRWTERNSQVCLFLEGLCYIRIDHVIAPATTVVRTPIRRGDSLWLQTSRSSGR
jgi:hypothetical protein